ncbi:S41 family peptidase [Sphingomicrobium astaxanthinifaciens]|uniref:S41 family peptidase n=1 Tax=Sphingomicrobium astaxanthinifaciens TaxID=1227949 RepID=UPI001FCC2A4B|nr:S41 family peptidase [Sphingomicrobium astaxanthinifaciens]MCJ7421251.1 S41 family peptidase [Sphingomicrobium astaxanthinifaciens]
MATTMLASCGGGGSGGSSGGGSPLPPPTGGGGGGDSCSLDARKDWVLETLQEYYLYPDQIATNVNPDDYSTLSDYIEALLAPAYAAKLDKPGFTYVTSIEEENAQIANATFEDYGWRPTFAAGNALVLLETFESGPAYGQAGIDRGAEILRIGRSEATLTDPVTAYNNGTLIDLLFPSNDGEQVVVEFANPDYANPGTYQAAQIVTLTASEYSLDPISTRYGVEVFGDVGYVNLRTFATEKARTQLGEAFATLTNAGVDKIVVDVRYNGGGLVSVANYFGDLLSEGIDGEIFSETIYSEGVERNYAITDDDRIERFEAAANQIEPVRIAFVTTGRSASASELLANAFPPYYGSDTALVGSDTFGKPVGQIAIDREACDDRFRVIAFKTVNADGVGDYIDGLADVYPVTCRASDDYMRPLGNLDEASTSRAVAFVNGTASCDPIASASSGIGTRAVREDIVLAPRNATLAEQSLYGQPR